MEGSDVSMREELADMFSMTRDLLYQHLEGFDEKDLKDAPIRGGNAPLWILAHLVVNRNHLVRLVEGEAEPGFPWEKDAERGASGAVDHLPGKADLVRLFEHRHNTLIASLRDLEEEALDRCPEGSSIWRRRLILARFLHEAYHVGQIALARRAAGLPGVVK